MKSKLLISMFLLFFSGAYSQEQKKISFLRNQIGIQLNPYIDKNLFNGLMHPVIGIRYGYRVTEPFILGIEASGSFSYFFHHSDHLPNYVMHPGLFARYSLPSRKRLQCSLEVSPYLWHYHQNKAEMFDIPEIAINRLGIYFAPGITIYTKNRRVSFDLYYKFSNLEIINNTKSVFSYKVDYHF